MLTAKLIFDASLSHSSHFDIPTYIMEWTHMQLPCFNYLFIATMKLQLPEDIQYITIQYPKIKILIINDFVPNST